MDLQRGAEAREHALANNWRGHHLTLTFLTDNQMVRRENRHASYDDNSSCAAHPLHVRSDVWWRDGRVRGYLAAGHNCVPHVGRVRPQASSDALMDLHRLRGGSVRPSVAAIHLAAEIWRRGVRELVRIPPNEGAPANRHPLLTSAERPLCFVIGFAINPQRRVPVAELGR